jgi:hypothetical protein
VSECLDQAISRSVEEANSRRRQRRRSGFGGVVGVGKGDCVERAGSGFVGSLVQGVFRRPITPRVLKIPSRRGNETACGKSGRILPRTRTRRDNRGCGKSVRFWSAPSPLAVW